MMQVTPIPASTIMRRSRGPEHRCSDPRSHVSDKRHDCACPCLAQFRYPHPHRLLADRSSRARDEYSAGSRYGLRDRDTARKVPSVIGERKRCFDVTSAGLEHVPSHALKFPGSEAGHRLVQPGMVRSALRATCCGTVIDRLTVSIHLKPRLARSAHFEDAAP